jgi:tetratricopeptide (TPR) repeat protein
VRVFWFILFLCVLTTLFVASNWSVDSDGISSRASEPFLALDDEQPKDTQKPTEPKISVPKGQKTSPTLPRSRADDAWLAAKALSMLNRGDTRAAERLFARALELNPRNNVALGELVHILETTKRQTQAITLLNEILAKCPDCADATLALGNLHLKSGDIDQAIVELENALDHSSVEDAALEKLFTAYLKINNEERAIDVMENIIARQEDHLASVRLETSDVAILERSLNANRKRLTKLLDTLHREG